MSWRKTAFQIPFFYLIYLAVYFVLPQPRVDSEIVTIVLSITTFTFAIIVGFLLSGRNRRISQIRTRLRENDARLLHLYRSVSLFGKTKSKKCLKLIEDHFILQLDYRLEDIDKSTRTLLKLNDFVLDLRPRTVMQNHAAYYAIGHIEAVMRNSREISHLVKSKMSKHEWGSLFALIVVIWICLFLQNDGSIFMLITIPILATTLALFLFILQDFNNLTRGERTWIWIPIISVFNDLELTPYVPEEIFEGRVSKKIFASCKEYRVVSFPDGNPDPDNKVVKVIKNK